METSKIFTKIFGEQIYEYKKLSDDDNTGRTTENSVSAGGPPAIDEERQDSQSNENILAESMRLLPKWLEKKIGESVASDSGAQQHQQEHSRIGRIGPDKVIFEIDHEPTFKISDDCLTVQSQGTFSTIKANICLYSGRWMYEVQLHSKGVMQIGFCSNQCNFSTDIGVGDTPLSYGFDGSKQQIWHITTSIYGEKWQTGDIIGVCIDIDNELLTFYRNGVSMGVAFKTIERGPAIALYPAMSLAFNEEIHANFGGTPFRYPINDYKPLQKSPTIELDQFELLFGYLMNIVNIMSRPKHLKNEKRLKDNGKSTKNITYYSIAAILIDQLIPYLMNSYIIENKLYHYIKNLCVVRSETDKDSVVIPGSPESTLGTLLTLFWTCLETFEINFLLNTFLNMLVSWYIETSKDLEYERQRKVIVILTCLCNHSKTRKYYIDHRFFEKNCLPTLLYLRPPEYSAMINIIPDDIVWTKGIGGSREQYHEICKRLQKSIEGLYALQKHFFIALLNNDDDDFTTGSSRKIFLVKLRKYVMQNSLEHRAFFLLQPTNPSPIESPIALSFMCILIDIIRDLYEKEYNENSSQEQQQSSEKRTLTSTSASSSSSSSSPLTNNLQVDVKYFLDGSFKYNHFDRVGGVLSHLTKMHRSDVDIYLGDNHETVNNAEYVSNDSANTNSDDVFSHMFIISGTNGFTIVGRAVNFQRSRTPDLRVIPGKVKIKDSLNELLDICILYYYAVGHKHVLKIVAIRNEIENINDVLLETTFYREDVKTKLKELNDAAGTSFNSMNSEILKELEEKFGQRTNVFAKRSIELGRKQAWYRAVALGEYRRDLLIWLLEATLCTLNTCSNLGSLFSFVPEVYVNILPLLLDSVIDFSIHDVAVQFDLYDVEGTLNRAADFLARHSLDGRIALAACKDSLLHALGTVMTHEKGIKALEQSSKDSQMLLCKALLRPYENRAWGQSNWLLLRFWLGHGFAYRDARPPNVWQGGNKPINLGLLRSRGRNESHTGLLHHVAPAYPSEYFQTFIGNILRDDEPSATKFLNSVLSQLNWAFSEFILLLQELQNIANRQDNETLYEPRQLKICAMCFELTVSLMRCLEMILTITPSICQDASRPNSDLLLNRICQLISQVLSRVSVPPGCFQFVIDLSLPDLSCVTHFSIITAALGILLALLKDELETIDEKPVAITRVTRALLTDPSFQIANIEFALGEVKTPIITQSEIPRGNFDPKMRAHIDPLTNNVRVEQPATSSKRIRANPPILKFSLSDYSTHVTSDEIEKVQKLIHLLQLKQSLLSDIILPSEDSLCPICCAKPVSVTFAPCNHQSCSNCILQHLLNSKVCFYCKSVIQNVKTFDGELIYENVNYLSLQNTDSLNFNES